MDDGDLVLKLHGAEMQELPGKVAVVTLHTSRGDIQAYLHPSQQGKAAVIWAGGASGDVNGPAAGVFADLAGDLAPQGVSSLRIRYRHPNRFYECVLDILAGASFLRGLGSEGIAVAGHGQGGAAAIMAGVLNDNIRAVAALACQGYGTHLVRQLGPRPLLVIHGANDEVCSPITAKALYAEANEPKQLVIYDDAGHSLIERRDELAGLLGDWLVDQLGGTPQFVPMRQPTLIHPIFCDDPAGFRVKQLVLFQGDITSLDVDAVVCPNNEELWVASGVTGAILRKGGETILREAVAHGPAHAGSCIVTGAGHLPCRFVFHAIAAPIQSHSDTATLERAVASCFGMADRRSISSIAFPAMGAGGGGLPFELSAAVLVPAAVDWLRRSSSLEKVVFALYGPGAFRAFSSRLDAEA